MNHQSIIRRKKEWFTLNIIHCYAPTMDDSRENRGQFYVKLQSVVQKYPGKDLTILIGEPKRKIRYKQHWI